MKNRICKPALVLTIVLFSAISIRIVLGEPCRVPTPSMEPAIMAGDWLWIDKLSYGGILPERWADIPLLNIFTYNAFLRNLDAQTDWGYHRLPGFGKPQVGDIVIFKSPEDREVLLVKRVAEIYYSGKNRYYYCLGDNSENSHDSRAFGYVPEELIVGKALPVLSRKNP